MTTLLTMVGALFACGAEPEDAIDDDALAPGELPLVAAPIEPQEAPDPETGGDVPIEPVFPDTEVCCNVPGAAEPMTMEASDCWGYGGMIVPMEQCSCDAVVGLCPGMIYQNCPYSGSPNAINGDMNCDGVIDSRYICPPGTSPADLDGDGCEEICACDECEDFWGLCPGMVYPDCPYVGASNAIYGDYGCDGTLDVRFICPPGTSPADPNGDGCDEICACDDGGTPGDTDGGGGNPELVCCDQHDGTPPSFVPVFECTSSGGNVLNASDCYGPLP